MPVSNQVTKWGVNQLVGNGPLRDLVKGAIGVKSQRYPDASAMLDAAQP